MKTTKQIVCILICLLINQLAQTQIISNSTPITENGEYSTPVWSPKGDKILITNHHNNELLIVDLKNKNKIQSIKSGDGIGYLANWSDDGKKIIFREKPSQGYFADVKVKSIDITTKNEKFENDIHPDNTKFQPKTKSGEKLSVYINLETTKLEVKKGANEKPQTITKEEGQFYHPLISPNGKMVAVHEGASIYIYNLTGNENRKYAGNGLVTAWLSDSSAIITFEDKSNDGHTITSSDLFLTSIQSLQKTQLTFSEDIIEMYADISPNGKKIAYADEKSGKIFIADFNLNK
ncbi:hypothetical protein [uncultured Aquimarina sp.]|uniref:TolB family protein n=1 Tax=uncultured Aquimarina sp. TaxID=575652 RepID=UPI002618BEDB|nr:hypothetical protein [uncultured Aquimarina sp.]